MFGMFSKEILAGSSASSSLIIICLIVLERFNFFGRGKWVLADSFNLVASEPGIFRIFTVSVDGGIESIGVILVKMLSWQLELEVDGVGLFP